MKEKAHAFVTLILFIAFNLKQLKMLSPLRCSVFEYFHLILFDLIQLKDSQIRIYFMFHFSDNVAFHRLNRSITCLLSTFQDLTP